MEDNRPGTVVKLRALVAGMLVNLLIGTYYNYSNINPYIAAYYKVKPDDTIVTSQIWLMVQSIFAILSVKAADKVGYWTLNIVSYVLFAALNLVISFIPTYIGFIFIYGIFSGVFIGLGYLPSLYIAWTYFPNSKSLATGLILFFAGMSATILSPVSAMIVNPHNLSKTHPDYGKNVPLLFQIFSIIFGAIALIAGFLQPQPWHSDHFEEHKEAQAMAKDILAGKEDRENLDDVKLILEKHLSTRYNGIEYDINDINKVHKDEIQNQIGHQGGEFGALISHTLHPARMSDLILPNMKYHKIDEKLSGEVTPLAEMKIENFNQNYDGSNKDSKAEKTNLIKGNPNPAFMRKNSRKPSRREVEPKRGEGRSTSYLQADNQNNSAAHENGVIKQNSPDEASLPLNQNILNQSADQALGKKAVNFNLPANSETSSVKQEGVQVKELQANYRNLKRRSTKMISVIQHDSEAIHNKLQQIDKTHCPSARVALLSIHFLMVALMAIGCSIYNYFLNSNWKDIYSKRLSNIPDNQLALMLSCGAFSNSIIRVITGVLLTKIHFKYIFFFQVCLAALGAFLFLTVMHTYGAGIGFLMCGLAGIGIQTTLFPTICTQLFGSTIGPKVYPVIYFTFSVSNFGQYFLYKYYGVTNQELVFYLFGSLAVLALIIGIFLKSEPNWSPSIERKKQREMSNVTDAILKLVKQINVNHKKEQEESELKNEPSIPLEPEPNLLPTTDRAASFYLRTEHHN
jgi:MFS family permease